MTKNDVEIIWNMIQARYGDLSVDGFYRYTATTCEFLVDSTHLICDLKLKALRELPFGYVVLSDMVTSYFCVGVDGVLFRKKLVIGTERIIGVHPYHTMKF